MTVPAPVAAPEPLRRRWADVGRRPGPVTGPLPTGTVPSSVTRVRRAVADLSAGRPVLVEDDRSHESHLVIASGHATAELVAFLVRYTAGLLFVAMTEQDADRLDLPPMAPDTGTTRAAVPAVTVDARDGITTGISARDRAHTIRLLASAATTSAHLSRPGHIVPVRVREGGVLSNHGSAEAAVDLAVLAELSPCATLAGLVSERQPARMAVRDEVRAFADEHRLARVSIVDLVEYRQRFDVLVERMAEARMPLAAGAFTAIGYRGVIDGRETIALVHGDVRSGEVPVHVHPECLAGDVFGSSWCDCGGEFQAALRDVARDGRGVVLYQRGPGCGTSGPAARCAAGRRAEPADLARAVQILRDLGVQQVRLVRGDPRWRQDLQSYGLPVR